MNNENKNHEVARYFCDNKIKAHITRKDNVFYNGLIKEVAADFFIIEDKEDGAIVVFYSELKNVIEQFQEVGK